MSNKNLSIIFTGQGSQYPEMGTDFIEKYEWARERYSISSDILGYNVLEAQNNKDLLNLKFNQKKSYWIEKTGPKSKMKNQF